MYSNSPEFVESPRFQVDIKFVPLKLASSVSVSDVAFGDSKNPNRVAFGQSDYDYMEYLVYLNDDFSGGDLIFEDSISIHPKSGNLIIFPDNLPHEVSPVSGKRYTVMMNMDMV